MRNRNINIPLRASEKEARMIEEKAARAKMNRTDYMIACAVGKRISVMEDLTPMIAELKRIGNNLNQALTLAHMEKLRRSTPRNRLTVSRKISMPCTKLPALSEENKWRP